MSNHKAQEFFEKKKEETKAKMKGEKTKAKMKAVLKDIQTGKFVEVVGNIAEMLIVRPLSVSSGVAEEE